MTTVLHAWLEGIYVGRFTLTGDHRATFDYDQDAPSTPVSLSLPRDGGWARAAPYLFLDNLLPDNDVTRSRMAIDSGAASDGVFDLLARNGADVAGGLVLTPTSDPPTASDGVLLPFTDDDIASRIATLRHDPHRWLDKDLAGGRFSLAGAQAKFTMALIGGRWHQSTRAIPSTHIVKPAAERTGDADLIEAATARLARLAGLAAPGAWILEVEGQRAYIVERFDRDTTVTPAARLHTEDLAQAAGMPRGQKYGMTAAQAIALLHRHDPTDTLGYAFVERLAFAVSTANADAHAKNYALVLRPHNVSLAPVYDQVTTAYWPWLDDRLAMKIDGAARSAEVAAQHWAKLAGKAGLDEDRVVTTAREVSRRVVEGAEVAYESLPAPVRDRLQRIVEHANHHMI